MTKDLKFEFHPDEWNIKTQYRSRNRMKFSLKLSAEEAQAFTNFSNSVKPDNVQMNDFVRSIFFAGIRAIEDRLTADLVKHMEENRSEYEASGFTFDTEGKLTGVDEASASGSVDIIE
tara:strand:- start:28986 stop:29339 length:354 start_codon:yes stop_codon:yes gene_type:complete